MYIYIYICICLYTHIHIYLCIYTYRHKGVYAATSSMMSIAFQKYEGDRVYVEQGGDPARLPKNGNSTSL